MVHVASAAGDPLVLPVASAYVFIFFFLSASGHACQRPVNRWASIGFRESETTIKIKYALFRGGGWAGWQRGKLSKTLSFMGNIMTIKF